MFGEQQDFFADPCREIGVNSCIGHHRSLPIFADGMFFSALLNGLIRMAGRTGGRSIKKAALFFVLVLKWSSF